MPAWASAHLNGTSIAILLMIAALAVMHLLPKRPNQKRMILHMGVVSVSVFIIAASIFDHVG